MAYSTPAQVEDAFPTEYGEPDIAAKVPGWIILADGTIDSSLRKALYETPLAGDIDNDITQASIDLTGIQMMQYLYGHENDLVDKAKLDTLIEETNSFLSDIEMGKKSFKKAKIKLPPQSYGDSYSTPRYSNFALPVGFPIKNDIND